jgi:hypothetical protein
MTPTVRQSDELRTAGQQSRKIHIFLNIDASIIVVEAHCALPATGLGPTFQCGSSQIVSWQISR